jgi:CRP-like cAMP-binding protein
VFVRALTRVNSGRLVFQDLLQAAAGAPLPEWERFDAAVQLLAADAGAEIFGQDRAHPWLYAVRQGVVKLVYLQQDGAEWVKSFSREGQFFGSLAALEPGGLTAFGVTAIEDVVLERVDYALMDELACRHLAWSRAAYRMLWIFGARKEQRERELLTLDAEQRLLAFRREHPELVGRIPQKDLARHLGVTAVGLSRIVGRLRRAG